MKIGDGVMELTFTGVAIGLHLLPDITGGYQAIGETQDADGYGNRDIGGKGFSLKFEVFSLRFEQEWLGVKSYEFRVRPLHSDLTIAGPLYIKPVHTCNRTAPTSFFSLASSAVNIPPLPIIGRVPFILLWI